MKYLFFILFMGTTILYSQVPDAKSLVKIHEATSIEINSITAPEKGSFVYDTTLNKMLFYNGNGWIEINDNPSTAYTGHFIITGTGSQTITGLPFEPSSISFVAHANIETTTINDDNGIADNTNTIANAFGSMNGYARNDSGTINQQVIYVGGNGTSINDISRYANPNECVGIRYSNQNGDNIGLTTASLSSFTSDGFVVNVTNSSDNLVVLFTAYK
ncbi:hypothetical protein [Zobellia nedashkovskayae]|uniref:hypothetical protein n=1 Tax=Zobellia nedashkovskayae TaxID=2779510 RepID=UPI00188D916F|nr:hypothetical protein [Zobellia nedashkovskayae]